jgi:hypothetical protein
VPAWVWIDSTSGGVASMVVSWVSELLAADGSV